MLPVFKKKMWGVADSSDRRSQISRWKSILEESCIPREMRTNKFSLGSWVEII